jgi:hypothetical protein
LRRSRSRSIRQIITASGNTASAPAISAERTSGRIDITNEIVPASITITSTKLAVIPTTWNLNREAAIRLVSSMKDSADERPGRRSIARKTKLTNPQASTKTAIASGPISLQAMTASAASWKTTTGARRARPRDPTSSATARRLAIGAGISDMGLSDVGLSDMGLSDMG